MSKSIKLKNNNYIDSTGIVHHKELLSDILENIQNIFKFKKITKNITIGANSITSFEIGEFSIPNGYTYLGVLPMENGYGDQFLVSYSKYGGNHIYAVVRSKYGAQLSNTISCMVIFVNTSYYNENS